MCVCWSSGTPAPCSRGWLHWHTLVARGTVPGWPQSKDCLSFTVWSCLLCIQLSSIHSLIHSFILSSQPCSPPWSHVDQAMKNKLWVSVWKGKWPGAWGPSGRRVGVTWEGSPCNGRLSASVSVAASNTSWSAPALLVASPFPRPASVSGSSAPTREGR